MHQIANESAPTIHPPAAEWGPPAPPGGAVSQLDAAPLPEVWETPVPDHRAAESARLAPSAQLRQSAETPQISGFVTLSVNSRMRLDPRTHERGLECVRCDACLPACPTFAETGLEADNPRGRIAAMLALSDGQVPPTAKTVGHLDGCLGCRACETACPSGVVFHELLDDTRATLKKVGQLKSQGRLARLLLHRVATRPRRLKLALVPVRLMQKSGLLAVLRRSGLMRLLPAEVRRLERMLPPGPVWPAPLPPHSRAGGFHTILNLLHPAGLQESLRPKQTVGLHAGCVGSVLFGHVNTKAAELIAAAGADVLAPPKQACCGAIHHRGGDPEAARELARRNIDLFADCDQIATATAGCGSMLREYGHLLRDDPAYAARANSFSRRVRDVTEVLAGLDLAPMRQPSDRVAGYLDACHLAHGQGVRREPRTLLEQVPGLTLVPLEDAGGCCGATAATAGMAASLAVRQLDALAAAGATVCVTGNGGCAMHLRAGAAMLRQPLEIVHPVDLLHAATFAAPPRVPLAERVDGFIRTYLVPIKDRLTGN